MKFNLQLLVLLFIFPMTTRASDTLLVHGHQFVIEVSKSKYMTINLCLLADTGKTIALQWSDNYDLRDEFGGSCSQTTYEVHSDSLILYERYVAWGEQRTWGYDIEADWVRKSTYVFQRSGKVVLLTRIYGSDNADVQKEVEHKTLACDGG